MCIDKKGQYFGELAMLISGKNTKRCSLLCLVTPTILPLILCSLPPDSPSILTPFLVTDTKG